MNDHSGAVVISRRAPYKFQTFVATKWRLQMTILS